MVKATASTEGGPSLVMLLPDTALARYPWFTSSVTGLLLALRTVNWPADLSLTPGGKVGVASSRANDAGAGRGPQLGSGFAKDAPVGVGAEVVGDLVCTNVAAVLGDEDVHGRAGQYLLLPGGRSVFEQQVKGSVVVSHGARSEPGITERLSAGLRPKLGAR